MFPAPFVPFVLRRGGGFGNQEALPIAHASRYSCTTQHSHNTSCTTQKQQGLCLETRRVGGKTDNATQHPVLYASSLIGEQKNNGRPERNSNPTAKTLHCDLSDSPSVRPSASLIHTGAGTVEAMLGCVYHTRYQVCPVAELDSLLQCSRPSIQGFQRTRERKQSVDGEQNILPDRRQAEHGRDNRQVHPAERRTKHGPAALVGIPLLTAQIRASRSSRTLSNPLRAGACCGSLLQLYL